MKRKVIAWLCVQFILVYAYFACPDSALAACEHYNNTVFPEDLNWVGAVPPGVGTAGWTGDGLCPVCGAVCEPGRDLEAFTDPNAASITEVPAVTEAPVVTQAPVITEAPVITQAPVATEAPVITQAPAVTEAPVITPAPTVTEAPVVTQAPVIIEAPVITQAPAATEAPVITQAPVATEAPVITQAPVATEAPVITQAPMAIEEPAVTEAPAVIIYPSQENTPVTTSVPVSFPAESVTEPAVIWFPEEAGKDLSDGEELPAIIVPEEVQLGTAGFQTEPLPDAAISSPEKAVFSEGRDGDAEESVSEHSTENSVQSGNGSMNMWWRPFSTDFPYRRMRFRPEQGIIIRRAGITVWPVSENGSAGSPLLNLLNR